MGILSSRPLPTPGEIKASLPFNGEHHVARHRQETNAIIGGSDRKRLLMVVGPCSAWPLESMEEYASEIARVQEQVAEHIKLIVRAYIQKPRSKKGWKGSVIQPDPQGKPDLVEGLQDCRKMMYDVGKIMPLADEMLNTHLAPYFEDALSYIAIGARSTLDQEKRGMASKFDCAVGVKNDMTGGIEDGVAGVEVANERHAIASINDDGVAEEVLTTGNPAAHLILRGGKDGPNYMPQDMAKAKKLFDAAGSHIASPAVIVDASHGNSGKKAEKQPHVVRDVLQWMAQGREGYDELVRGFMLEGHFEGGNQQIVPGKELNPRRSITDECLDLATTIALIRQTADAVDRMR